MDKKNAITDKNYETEVAKYKGPHMIEFFYDWCGHCQRMEPVIQQAVKEYKNKVRIFQVDIEESPKACEIHNVELAPTMVFVKGSQKQNMLVGEKPIEELRKNLDALL